MAIVDPKARERQQRQLLGEKVDEEIDRDAHISVELSMNQEVVNVKRRRLVLES